VRTKKDLLQIGFEFVDENHAWPRSTDLPSTTAMKRTFGSFAAYQSALMKAYTEKNGCPEWDTRGPAPPRTKTTFARELMADTFTEAIARVGAFPPTPVPKIKASKKEVAEMHLVISDVHVGSYVDPALASNLTPGFNIEQFRESADTMEERVLWFKKAYQGFECKKLVVNFLGDIVDGEGIFLGQALQNDRNVGDQVAEAAHRFASMFYNWAKVFPEVEVYCVPGNHGRIGRKGELAWRSNFDSMSYRFVQQILRGQKNVKVIISQSPNLIVKHGGTNWLLHHGDFVKGGAGSYIAYERKVQSIGAMGNIQLDYSVSGHYHHSASNAGPNARRYITNGSWPGTNQFSVDVLNTGNTPAQRMWLFSPSNGFIHSESDIVLGDRVTLTPDKDRVYTDHE
jgi:hypothetical protein